jgi:hypothetical protein
MGNLEYIGLRQKVAHALKNKGYRVLSPFKVPAGWIDVAVLGRKSIGIDFYAGNYSSCIERLTSYPFQEILPVGNCDGCMDFDELVHHLDVEIGDTSSENEGEAIIRKISENENKIKAKTIEDAVAFIYIAGEVFEGKAESYDYKPLKLILPDLKQWGLAVSNSRSKLNPVFFVSLTREGYRVGETVIERRIRIFEKKLRKMAEEHLTYLIAMGVSRELRVLRNHECRDFSLKSLLEFMKNVPLDFGSKIFYDMVYPKLHLCEFLVKTALNAKAVELAENLSRMGLAAKVDIYSPYGEKMGEEFRFARAAIEALLKMGYADVGAETLNEFMTLTYPLFHRDIYPVLKYGEEYLMRAKKAGVCEFDGYRFHAGENFEEYVRIRLAMLIERLIGSIPS